MKKRGKSIYIEKEELEEEGKVGRWIYFKALTHTIVQAGKSKIENKPAGWNSGKTPESEIL